MFYDNLRMDAQIRTKTDTKMGAFKVHCQY